MPIIHKLDQFTILRKINDRIAVIWTKHLIWKFRIKDPVLMFYEPRFASVLGRISKSLVWYEVIDDRLGFSGVPRWIKGNIDQILSNADLVTVTSSQLYEMTKSRTPGSVQQVGNGVDFAFFSSPHSVPEEMKAFAEKQVIGYIGSIGEWFDFDIVEEMAIKFPSAAIIIIGFVFSNVTNEAHQLEKRFQNIRFLGTRRYELLPDYVQTFTVCIIPFKVNDMTRAVNPVKFYEYCSQGKPIVTTALPELKRYSDIIGYAESKNDFIRLLDIMLKDTRVNKDRLREIAKENSWERKVEIIIELLTSLEKR